MIRYSLGIELLSIWISKLAMKCLNSHYCLYPEFCGLNFFHFMFVTGVKRMIIMAFGNVASSYSCHTFSVLKTSNTFNSCLLQVLKPFYAASKELCTEPYACMSKLIPISTLLQQVTDAGISTTPSAEGSSTSSTATQTQAALRNALATQMQQHLANVENNYRLAAATLLDPR